MQVKYIGKGSLHSKGHRFESGEEYTLLEDTFNYMLQTFPLAFESLEKEVEITKEPEVEVEVEVEVEAPKPKRKRAKRAIAPEKD